MQSDDGTVDINIDWQDSVVDPIIDGLETLLEENVVSWGTDIWTDLMDSFLQDNATYLEGLFEELLGPIIGTPAPEGPASPAPLDVAFNSAANSPWNTLISDLYFEGIVGLALGIQFITWALIGIRYKSINPVVRQKLGRRCLIAFLSLFFWLPVASMATQFFDILGRQIVAAGYEGSDAVVTVLSLSEITSVSWGVGIILVVVAAYVYLKALFVFIARWIMTILLTVAMPLVASFWVLEVWPFNRFAGLSKQVAGAYPGLLAAGIPPAILIRISLATSDFGLEGLTFFVATITIYLAAKSQKIMVRRSSRAATRISEQVLSGAKKPIKFGGAAAGVAATAGAGLAAGPAAATAVGGGINAASNAVKGRPGRAAYSAQMVHRAMANGNFGGSGTSPTSFHSTPSGSSTGSPRESTGPVPHRSQTGGSGPRPPQSATAPRSGNTQTSTTDSPSQNRLPRDGDVSQWSTEQDGHVTYFDVVGSGVTVEDSPPDSDAISVSSQVEDTDDDDAPASAAPAAGANDDPPDDAGAGQTDPTFEDMFAGGDDPLGPGYYRDP
jgi:hypothetical protein